MANDLRQAARVPSPKIDAQLLAVGASDPTVRLLLSSRPLIATVSHLGAVVRVDELEERLIEELLLFVLSYVSLEFGVALVVGIACKVAIGVDAFANDAISTSRRRC